MAKKKIVKKKPILLLLIIYVILSMYVGGILKQKTNKGISTDGGWTYQAIPVNYNIVECISQSITPEGLKYSFLSFAGIGILSMALLSFAKKNTENQDERGFNKSKKGTYGTSGWMDTEDIAKNLDIKPIKRTDGTILGELDGDIVSLPIKSKLNKHIAIYGASGTGKSRCFVRSQIMQCVARNESVIITDPKGEIFADTATFMKNNGYNVKVFNLVNPTLSNSWNCLNELGATEDQVELMAQTFASVIIQNTMEGGKGDHFWDNAEMNLLKALCLIVFLDESRSPESKNIGAVYEMLTGNSEKDLAAQFSQLRANHPALKPWNIFNQASESVRGNVIIGLGSRIQVFQSPDIRRITQYEEIDLEAPAKEKCGYFVIMSDQNSTLDFLSSLFFSFLFIRLVKYADVYGKNGACDVPVNFILDEFPNIGKIPDFTKKLSTIRSRDLRVAVIFQNIAQLQQRYPDGLWEEIIGNCDTQLFLGCTDATTAEFISKRTGEMTIEVNSQGVKKETMAVIQSVPSYSETTSVGKRALLTPDEVMRLPNENALIILRGQKVIKVNKYDYSKHPTSEELVYQSIKDFIPPWKQALDIGLNDNKISDIVDFNEGDKGTDEDDDMLPIKKPPTGNQDIPQTDANQPDGKEISKEQPKSTQKQGLPPTVANQPTGKEIPKEHSEKPPLYNIDRGSSSEARGYNAFHQPLKSSSDAIKESIEYSKKRMYKNSVPIAIPKAADKSNSVPLDF